MHETKTLSSDESGAVAVPKPPMALGLVVAWARCEPGRIGEVCVVPPTRASAPFVLGRGPARPGEPARLAFFRHRAGVVEPRPPLESPRISRHQLNVRARGTEELRVERTGRCPLHHNGVPVDAATVVPGDTLQLGGEILFLCVERPAWIPPAPATEDARPFGEADSFGFVGESPAAWDLRRRIAFVAPRREHVLIFGESGTGKELAARALHALSPRASGPLVARNAATLPEGLVDAELFGHVRNYPNAGMPERLGLVGQAHGGTLFLDEIAELPLTLQTHLLRVLDSGEYQRLGDSTARTSDVRLLAATNRPEHLRPELAARFKLSLQTVGLNERREDLPLLIVHQLRTIARGSGDLAARLFPDADATGSPRVSLRFIEALLRHPYSTHVRELEGILWKALADDSTHVLDAAPPTFGKIGRERTGRRAVPRMANLSSDAIVAALAANDGSLERTWRALGLGSRHVLARLLAKRGLRRP